MAASFKRGLVFCIVVLIIGTCIVAYEHIRENDAVRFFSQALEREHIQLTVVVEGKTYVVSGDTVERNGTKVEGSAELPAMEIAYAHALAERSPLFALPGTDVDELDNAITALAASQKDLAHIQATSSDAEAVESALYPIEFLRALDLLERARLELLSAPSDVNAKHYADAGESATTSYLSDLARFRAAFDRLVPTGAAQYGTLGGVISKKSSLDSMDGLERMALDMRSEQEKRNLCLAGNSVDCDETDIALPALTPVEPAHQDFSPASLTDILSLYDSANDGDQKYLPSPVVELAHAMCTDASGAAPLYSVHSHDLGIASLSDYVVYVGDILFNDTQTLGKDIPYYQYYQDNDVRYVIWRPSSHYTCADFDTDLGATLAVMAIRTAAKRAPLSAYVSGEDAANLRQLEHTLTQGGQVVRETDARAYLVAARNALVRAPQPQAESELSQLTYMLEHRSAGFDQLLYRVASVENIDMHLLSSGIPVELDARYLFYVRSGFFSLLLGGEEPATSYRSPVDTSVNITQAELPFVFYSKSADTVPRSKFIHDMNFYFSLHS